MIAILASGVRTWMPNMVWIIPSFTLVVAGYRHLHTQAASLMLAATIFALIVAGFPEGLFMQIFPFGRDFLRAKYALAELLLFVSLLGSLVISVRHDWKENPLPTH